MRIRRLLFLLLLVPCFFHVIRERAFCAEAENGQMDLVLLIDMSGSMKYTDPDGMAREGALLFMDLLKEDAAQVCIIGFSDTVEILRPLQPLKMETEREQIRELLSAYPRERDTDLGAALSAAVDVLKNRGQSGSAAILLFTDGSIDLPAEEEVQRSLDEAKAAALLAAEEKIPLYCIGLDREENTSDYHLDRTLLEALAHTGDGSFRYVTEADLLPDLFHQVVADCFDSTSGRIGDLASRDAEELSELSFSIPDRSAARANVILLPESGRIPEDLFRDGGLTLTDPSGEILRAGDENRLQICSSEAYLVLKLTDPMPGTWKLQTLGGVPFHVHVNLLFLYELEIEAKAEEQENGTVLVTAWFTRGKERLRDPALYRNFHSSAAIVTENVPGLWIEEHFPDARPAESDSTEGEEDPAEGGLPENEKDPADGGETFKYELQLTASGDGDGYSGTFAAWPGMDAKIRISAHSDRYEVAGNRIDFTSGGSGAIIVGNLPDEIHLESMLPGKTVSGIRPQDWFAAWDESRLSIRTVSSDESVFTAGMEGDAVSLTGNRSGFAALCVTVMDRYGSCFKVRIPVTVKIHMAPITDLLRRAGFAAALAVLLLLPVLWLRSRRCLKGALVLSVSPEGSRSEEYVCHFPEGLRKITLAELIRSGSQTQLIRDQLLKILPADRLLISSSLHGTGCTLSLRDRAGDGKLADCFGRDVRRTVLRDGDTFELTSKKAEKETGRYPDGGTLYGYYDGAGTIQSDRRKSRVRPFMIHGGAEETHY